MIATAGDYQTAKRMADKLRAIPIPDDLTGLSVLDVGCDHGGFCKLASDRGAARVLGIDRGREVRGAGFVDLAARNTAEGWRGCEFRDVSIGRDWPELGKFDLVFCFSLYHHVYGETGDHLAIWRWLWQQTRGTLLWESPVDTRDTTARDRARKHGNYTRDAIWNAASNFFHVEHIGPALHRSHREVWRCTPRTVPNDRGDGPKRVRPGVESVPQPVARPNGADPRRNGLVAVSGDAERVGRRPHRGDPVARATGGRHRSDEPVGAAADVVRRAARYRKLQQPARRHSAPRPEPDAVSGDRSVISIADVPEGWRPADFDSTRALILGGAKCVWDDVRRVESMLGRPWNGLVIAVNDVGCVWPRRLDHWCSLHAEKFGKWETARRKNGHPGQYETWGSRQKKKVGRNVQPWGGGSSGLFAVTVAVDHLECSVVILCGVPMDKQPHFPESLEHQPTRAWNSAEGHWRTWKKDTVQRRMLGKVRSMSGRTRDMLGEPDCEWLGCFEEAA
jgi:SAM-dependent methyltransferase